MLITLKVIFKIIFQFNHEVVAQVACDILLLICDYTNTLMEWYVELPSKAIEVRIT